MTKIPNSESQRKRGDPWYKRYPRDIYEATRALSLEARGAYNDVLDLMYIYGGPIPDDSKWMSHALHVSTRKWDSIKQALIEAGKITIEGGEIHNSRVDSELAQRRLDHRTGAESTANRGRTKREKSKTTNKINGTETKNQRYASALQNQNQNIDTESVGLTTVESVAAREPDRPPDDQNFSDCKLAFNGSTEAMLVEVMAAMQPYGDRRGASQWLATTMRTNGAEPTAQAFQMLANARAEGQVIARVLPWWAKTAASLKANPQTPKPQSARDGPKHWREERAERAKIIYDLAMGVTSHA